MSRRRRRTGAPGCGWPSTGLPPRPPATWRRGSPRRCGSAGGPCDPAGTFGFLRPASLRLEYGHEDPDAYHDEWFDRRALWREVFQPLDPGGTGRVLPDLWDAVADRATRSGYVELPPGGVLLLHGPLLFGHWFPFDLAVHLKLSPAALARRTPEGDRWTLPAFARYEQETRPEEAADIVVRADDPRRPAWSGTA